MSGRTMWIAGMCVAWLLSCPVPGVGQDRETLHESPLRRRPVAGTVHEDSDHLLIVNHQSGTITRIRLDETQVAGEWRIGDRPTAMVPIHGGDLLLVPDAGTDALLIVDVHEERPRVLERIPVPHDPQGVSVAPDEQTVAVTSRWSRRVTLLTLGAVPSDMPLSSRESIAVSSNRIRLPFAPRESLFVDDGRSLAVADAFGGRLALVDVGSARVVSIRELPAQNIRGMILTADRRQLLVTHQVLSPLARADFDDIHWGNLLRNVVSEVSLPVLLDSNADLLEQSRTVPLGEVGNGAGDPAGITLIPELDGWAVCLAGTDEVLIRTRYGGGRVGVGPRPVRSLWDPQRNHLLVVCSLGDEVVCVDPSMPAVIDTVALGPSPVPTPADRGEVLFGDARRSHDGWLSCQSCHPDGHTTGLLADTSSDDSFGTPKRILSLLGTRDNNPWAWNGQFRELHEQVASSFSSTLQGAVLRPDQVSDVVAYLHTLASPPPVDSPFDARQQELISRGARVFDARGCGRCHVPPLTYTIDRTFDVGLSDEAGLKDFNPPSLRGVSHRERFFHDGRAKSLEAVFTEYGHQLEEELSESDGAALMAFLRTL